MPDGRRDTIEAKISSEMPLPMPRWVISSPIHINRTQPAVRQTAIRKIWARRTCSRPIRRPGQPVCETETRSRLTGEGETNREIARVLGEYGLPTSPSLESFSSDGTHPCSSFRMIEEVMYGMIPARISRSREAATGERIQEAEDARATHSFWRLLTALR